MIFVELVLAQTCGQASVQNQVWIPQNDKPLVVSRFDLIVDLELLTFEYPQNNLKLYCSAINLTPTIKTYSLAYTAPLLVASLLHLLFQCGHNFRIVFGRFLEVGCAVGLEGQSDQKSGAGG